MDTGDAQVSGLTCAVWDTVFSIFCDGNRGRPGGKMILCGDRAVGNGEEEGSGVRFLFIGHR